MSNRELPVGQVLEYRCELFPGQFLDCKLEVMHVDDTRLGTKIKEIEKNGTNLCQSYLEEEFADRAHKNLPK